MKWGAGSLRYRECVMRERVVKHTLTLIFSFTQIIIFLSPLTHTKLIYFYLSKNTQKKSQNTLNSRVKSSIFKGKMPFFHILTFSHF
jgi:hypothetical protein